MSRKLRRSKYAIDCIPTISSHLSFVFPTYKPKRVRIVYDCLRFSRLQEMPAFHFPGIVQSTPLAPLSRRVRGVLPASTFELHYVLLLIVRYSGARSLSPTLPVLAPFLGFAVQPFSSPHPLRHNSIQVLLAYGCGPRDAAPVR